MILQKHESYPDDNAKKLCDWSQVLHNKWKKDIKITFDFFPLKFFRLKQKNRLRNPAFSPFFD